MNKMRISVIGAGNGGQAMAGHFSLLGHQVTLYNRTLEKIEKLILTKEINLSEAITGITLLHQVTNDLELAISQAELIMVTTTANAHKELAQKMAPYLKDGQVIVLNPGRTLGALEFSNELKQITAKKIYIAEAQSLIYACRAETPGRVRIIGVKDRVLLSAYPSAHTDHVLNVLNSIFPCFIKSENILRTSLENIGAILHPSVILFNAAAIERGNMFYFYNDMTPTVANFIVEVDKERLSIGKAYSIPLLSVSDWISYAYKNIQGEDFCSKIQNNPAYHKILAPDHLHSRLMVEDIPTGILPMLELATKANIETPLMRSIFHIAQCLLKTDFIKDGRTLENLGLKNIPMNDFIKSL